MFIFNPFINTDKAFDKVKQVRNIDGVGRKQEKEAIDS